MYCKDCRHWERFEKGRQRWAKRWSPDPEVYRWGDCVKIRDVINSSTLPDDYKVYVGGYEVESLETRDDFGCVLFEQATDHPRD